MYCSIVKMTLRHKKTCRNKLTLYYVYIKRKIFSFSYFFDQWNFSTEDCTVLEIFVHLSLDITFHAIEYCVTTCPGYGKSCHRWLSLIKWSLTTIVLRLKEIRYCSIVTRGSLKTLAYHSLPKYWMQKIQKSWNKICN